MPIIKCNWHFLAPENYHLSLTLSFYYVCPRNWLTTDYPIIRFDIWHTLIVLYHIIPTFFSQFFFVWTLWTDRKFPLKSIYSDWIVCHSNREYWITLKVNWNKMPRHWERLSVTVIVKVQKPTNFDKDFTRLLNTLENMKVSCIFVRKTNNKEHVFVSSGVD